MKRILSLFVTVFMLISGLFTKGADYKVKYTDKTVTSEYSAFAFPFSSEVTLYTFSGKLHTTSLTNRILRRSISTLSSILLNVSAV